jgi:hypothetical protein
VLTTVREPTLGDGYVRKSSMSLTGLSRLMALLMLGCALSFLGMIIVLAQSEAPIKPVWETIRITPMASDLRIFWGVYGDNAHNHPQAVARGFELYAELSTYADYRDNQKENIVAFLGKNRTNPWRRPPFFEKSVRLNIAEIPRGRAMIVHDIEIEYEHSATKAWLDREARAASGATTLEEFTEAYYREWAKWFWLPCAWTKEQFPDIPVGIYGVQPFRRGSGPADYGPEGTMHGDEAVWKYIDPHVDFYVASTYISHDGPETFFYLASTVEESFKVTRAYGSKPVYAYVWPRFHEGSPRWALEELPADLVEAMAVVPFFSGARGVVLWGYEPTVKGQPYTRLPEFMNSLGRVSDLSARIAAARLLEHDPAHVLWKEKLPLVRVLQVADDECVIMASNPWQGHQASSTVQAYCGALLLTLPVEGRRTEIFYSQGPVIIRK